MSCPLTCPQTVQYDGAGQDTNLRPYPVISVRNGTKPHDRTCVEQNS